MQGLSDLPAPPKIQALGGFKQSTRSSTLLLAQLSTLSNRYFPPSFGDTFHSFYGCILSADDALYSLTLTAPSDADLALVLVRIDERLV